MTMSTDERAFIEVPHRLREDMALSAYRGAIDSLLGRPDADEPRPDWPEVYDRHLRWIGYFQHERIVHLLVTLFFGLFTLLTAIGILLSPAGEAMATWPGFLLGGFFLIMLIAYLRHYYRLENGVQALYRQSDKIRERVLADRCAAASGDPAPRFTL